MQPMMSEKEVRIITELLKPNWDCMEFGSGWSSVEFSPFVRSWTTREHNPEWAKTVKDNAPENCRVELVTCPDSYICVNGQFDFILVDGVHRKECLTNAMRCIKPNGIILLHDACRREYAEWLNDYPNKLLIEGEIPDGEYFLHRGIRQYNI